MSSVSVQGFRWEGGDSASYLDRLKLDRAPFAQSKEDLYFADPQLMQRIDLLQHLTQFSDLLLSVTGTRGSGKTMLFQEIIHRSYDNWDICAVSARHIRDQKELLVKLAEGFALDPFSIGEELPKKLVNHWKASQLMGTYPVLLIDDAQCMDLELLRSLLALDGSAQATLHRVRVILFGDESLDNLLEKISSSSSGDNPQVHRISVTPFSEEQTEAYLIFRLAIAGYSGESPFSSDQVHSINKVSGGWPGEINRLAHHTLEKQEKKGVFHTSPEAKEATEKRWKLALWIMLLLVALFLLFATRGQLDGIFGRDIETQTVIPLPAPAPMSASEKESTQTATNDTSVIDTNLKDRNSVERKAEQSTSPPVATSKVAETRKTEVAKKPEPEKKSALAGGAGPDTRGQNMAPGSRSPIETGQAVNPGKPNDTGNKKSSSTQETDAKESSTVTARPATSTPPITQTDSVATEPLTPEAMSPAETGARIEQQSAQEKSVHDGVTPENTGSTTELQQQIPDQAVVDVAKTKLDDRAEIQDSGTETSESESWILRQDPEKYTMQLLSVRDKDAVLSFIKSSNLSHDVAYFKKILLGTAWYSLISGSFESRQEAQEAAGSLPDSLSGRTPWIRKFSSIQKEIN